MPAQAVTQLHLNKKSSQHITDKHVSSMLIEIHRLFIFCFTFDYEKIIYIKSLHNKGYNFSLKYEYGKICMHINTVSVEIQS